MCLLVFEFFLLIYGIVTLAKGKVNISHNRIVTGVPAYMAGLVMLMVLPLNLMIGLTIGFVLAARGDPVDFEKPPWVFGLIEIGVTLIAVAILVFINLSYGKPPEDRRRFDRDWDDEDDQYYSRRRRRSGYDDEEEGRPRRHLPEDDFPRQGPRSRDEGYFSAEDRGRHDQHPDDEEDRRGRGYRRDPRDDRD